jgi:hypothetical protein
MTEDNSFHTEALQTLQSIVDGFTFFYARVFRNKVHDLGTQSLGRDFKGTSCPCARLVKDVSDNFVTEDVMNLVGVSVILGKKMGPIEERADFGGRKTRE